MWLTQKWDKTQLNEINFNYRTFINVPGKGLQNMQAFFIASNIVNEQKARILN